jgi:hypothetical protein
MSHFTVLVIGDNPEEQLAPYHEFECTGLDDEHIIEIDITEDTKEDYKKHADDLQSFVEFVEDWHGYKLSDEDRKYGYIEKDDLGEFKVIRRTNPNAKWDWYQVGGRWTGFFKLKEGGEGLPGETAWCAEPAKEGEVDIVFKGDVDFEAMRKEAADDANKKYSMFENATKRDKPDRLEVPPTWKEIRENHDGDIEAAREEWNSYPWVKALHEADLYPWMEDVLDYYCVGKGGREIFVKRAIDQVGVPYAFVKDYKWYEKGEMGWWGMASNEMEQYEWNEQFQKMLDELPDDTVLTLVDCHI